MAPVSLKRGRISRSFSWLLIYSGCKTSYARQGGKQRLGAQFKGERTNG